MHKLNVEGAEALAEVVFFKKLSLTFKADDVTSNARDVDPHGRLRVDQGGIC